MKKYIRIVCLGLLMLGWIGVEQAIAQTAEDKPYKAQLALVENRLRQGNVSGAIETLDEIIREYPNAAEAHYAKALMFGQLRNYELAIASAKLAVESEPSNLLYANYLLELYKGSNNLPAALGLLDESIAKHSDNIVLYREKIMMLHANKQSDEALRAYELTKEKFGVSDTLDVIKAEILLDLEQLPEAEQLLTPWVAKQSPVRQVYSSLGYIYTQQKNIKKATQILEKGLQVSKDPLLHFDLADAYTASKKDKQAFDALLKAFESHEVNYGDKHRVMFTILGGKSNITLDQMQELANMMVLRHPRIADSHVAKGDVLWRRGNLQEARSLFLTAVGINPNHVDAWRMLMNVELGLNEVDAAIQHGQEALSVNPNNAMLLYFTGLSYMVKDDTDNSRKMLEAALDNSGEENAFLQSLIYAGLGDLYHKLSMSDVSDVAYEEAIKLDSTNATAMNNYAYYLAERNEKLDVAEKYSRLSNELDPNSGTFQDTYAWILFKKGDYSEALKWIQKALAGSEPSAVLYDHYGDILYKNNQSKEAVRQWEKALALNEGSDLDVEKLKEKITKKSYVE